MNLAKDTDTEKSFLLSVAFISENAPGPERNDHCIKIMGFVNSSDRVQVKIDSQSKALSWLSTQKNNAVLPALLCSYVAGNAKAQLVSKKKKDNPLAGVRMLLHTYQNIQASDKGFKIQEIEEVLKARDEKKLKELLNP